MYIFKEINRKPISLHPGLGSSLLNASGELSELAQQAELEWQAQCAAGPVGDPQAHVSQ